MPFKQISSSIELLKIMNILYKNKGYYVNVVPQDKLTKITPKKNSIIIVNFERSTQYGVGHWCLILCKDEYVLYADPFGQQPPESVLQFMRRFKQMETVNQLLYNKRQVQTFKDEYCGWFCLKIADLIINKKMSVINAIKNINSKSILSYGKQLYAKYLKEGS